MEGALGIPVHRWGIRSPKPLVSKAKPLVGKAKPVSPCSSSSSALSLFSLSFSVVLAAAVARQVEPGPDTPPPLAQKVPHPMVLFGDVRQDDYYWLRDDSRSNPRVLSYLEEETNYTHLFMADTKVLQEKLYEEMRNRIQEEDTTVPLRRGAFYYYEKQLKGKQYEQHCRRAIPGGEGPGSVDEVLNTDKGSPKEEVLLDENSRAENNSYYLVGAFKVSPNHKLYAFSEDTKGDEVYTVYFVDIESKRFVGKPLIGATEYMEWAGNDTLVYITQDDLHRPFKVWSHRLDEDQSLDKLLYHEEDEEFYLSLDTSESEQYLFVNSGSKTTQFVLYLKVSEVSKELKILTPRVRGVDTSASHRGGHFFITRRSDEAFNSELLVCSTEDIRNLTVILPHRPSVKLQEVQTLQDHLITFAREDGLLTATVYKLPSVGEPIRSLPKGEKIQFSEPSYTIIRMDSQFSSHILRYGYSSLRTPLSVYDYDLNEDRSVLKKVKPVLGDFDVDKYETVRRWATASDGIDIPISIVYRRDMVKLDGTDPMLLYGYGAYEVCIEAEFSAVRLPLIDRGFIYAIAHVRGGGEMGRKWYEDGKLQKKKNTFTDFISCAEYLLAHKYTSKEKLCINGRSAGGLLIGAVLNMRPDLFKTAVAGVPFVDVLTTMLDPSIPLTVAEWEEWGDPRKEEDYYYMKSYSPVDNVARKSYPNILVTAGLYDPRVGYWEPTKFVAKLRENKIGNSSLIMKFDLGAGHFSKSGRFDKLEEYAFTHFLWSYL